MEAAILTTYRTEKVEAARIITVSQITDGEAKCHCGEPAVLVVDTEPDNEPGATCYVHAQEWIGMALKMVEQLFGPKHERTL